MVPLLLPCATTGLSSIAAWCGSGAPPRGQQWPPACTLPHVRDGLRVRSRATFCPCGRSSMRRPAHRQFLRNALPDLTTIAPVTAYYRINYVRDTVGIATAWSSRPTSRTATPSFLSRLTASYSSTSARRRSGRSCGTPARPTLGLPESTDGWRQPVLGDCAAGVPECCLPWFAGRQWHIGPGELPTSTG